MPMGLLPRILQILNYLTSMESGSEPKFPTTVIERAVSRWEDRATVRDGPGLTAWECTSHGGIIPDGQRDPW
jgi:hypothetical protein